MISGRYPTPLSMKTTPGLGREVSCFAGDPLPPFSSKAGIATTNQDRDKDGYSSVPWFPLLEWSVLAFVAKGQGEHST